MEKKIAEMEPFPIFAKVEWSENLAKQFSTCFQFGRY
jgi:hypothetical protein